MTKKLLIFALAALVFQQSAMAWGRVGHEVVIEVAKHHLTDRAKANIAKYMAYDMTKDAVWMDHHRRDKEISYTSAWHVYNVDASHRYDPNPRLKKGDVVLALRTADYNLRHYTELSDSAVVMNLRMVLHFVGDMHCPTHSYFPGPRCFWKCSLNGKPQKTFHGVYDKMPHLLYPKVKSVDIANQIDDQKKGAIKKIQKGTFVDWVKDIADRNEVIYEWNPFNTEELNPDTVELSRDLVNTQMRNAGYRLARLLNEYFDK